MRTGINKLRATVVGLALMGLFTVSSTYAQIGTPPIIAVQPLGISVQNGGTATFVATAVSLTSMRFTWQCNNHPVTPANNTSVANIVIPFVGTVSTLTISNLTASRNGNYNVTVANGVGSVTSSNAPLIVLTGVVSNLVSFVSTGTGMVASGFQIKFTGPTTSNFVVQASTDLHNWIPIYTNTSHTGSVSYLDTAAKSMPGRFYRVMLQ
jgi:hypothetical protein